MSTKKKKPRDSQRNRLYMAEQEVSAYMRDLLPSLADIEKLVADVLASAWLRGQFTAEVLSPIQVLEGRQNQMAVAYASEIAMPRWSRSKFFVIHEVCHVLCSRHHGRDNIASHGEEFAALELEMVRHFLGEQDYLELRDQACPSRIREAFSTARGCGWLLGPAGDGFGRVCLWLPGYTIAAACDRPCARQHAPTCWKRVSTHETNAWSPTPPE